MRAADLRVPGSRCGIQLVEFETRDRKAVRLRIHDPGAVTLVLLVRDMDAAFARVRAAQVPVITTGGAPVMPSATSKTRAVLVTDPDGHFVELAQLATAPATDVPAASNVFDIRFRITVGDMQRSIAYYKDHLGIVIKPAAFQGGAGVMAMLGLPDTAEYSVTMTLLPGSTLIHEFLALRGVAGALSRARVQDPGAYRLELAVDDLDATLAALKSGGARVLTAGGGVVQVAGGRAAAVQDLNTLVLVLREASR
jgi:catechol 2,3-dioxygenase-like lactoylglutathione lyase family enzyme